MGGRGAAAAGGGGGGASSMGVFDPSDPEIASEIARLVEMDEFDSYGLRVDDKVYSLGDVLPNSRIWDDGDATDDLLPGTSTLDVMGQRDLDFALKQSKVYPGRNVYLVGGMSEGWGEDEGERIISKARIVKAWRRAK